jgi:hypothetical protein
LAFRQSKNIHPSRSDRSQFILREGHRLRTAAVSDDFPPGGVLHCKLVNSCFWQEVFMLARRMGIGAGHIDILGDRAVREDSPQRAQSPRRTTCFVLCLRGLCALCGDPIWLRLRRAALRRFAPARRSQRPPRCSAPQSSYCPRKLFRECASPARRCRAYARGCGIPFSRPGA